MNCLDLVVFKGNYTSLIMTVMSLFLPSVY